MGERLKRPRRKGEGELGLREEKGFVAGGD
jgi:hypothetical protein